MPAAMGHEPTDSEPTESEPAEHEPGDFEITIDPPNLIFDMPEAPQVEVDEKDRGEKAEGAKERLEAEKSKQSSISAIFYDLAKESRKGLRLSITA
ncbi:MAG: hypothetical protein Q9221_008882 [Calogaya cf. arnoldii]